MNQHNPQGPSGPGVQSIHSTGETTAESASQKVKQTAEQTTEKIKAKAGDIGTQARQKGEAYFTDKKELAAEKLEGAGEALHETSRRFEREHDPNIAHYTHLMADKLEDVAHYVRERTFTDLRHDAEDLARRHPAVFFGGMFVAGMAVARLLKASVDRPEEEFEFESEEEFSAEHVEPSSEELKTEPEYPSHPVPTL